MKKVFISYCFKDDRKKEILKEVFEAEKIECVIVVNKREPSKHLADKVQEGLEESNFFIPILTKKLNY